MSYSYAASRQVIGQDFQYLTSTDRTLQDRFQFQSAYLIHLFNLRIQPKMCSIIKKMNMWYRFSFLSLLKLTQMCSSAQEKDALYVDTGIEYSPDNLLSDVVLIWSLSNEVVEEEGIEGLKHEVSVC